MAGMQSDSLESRRINIVNYIRMHRDPRKGIINFRSKLINDPSASFLINGELEKETEMLEKQSNTFLDKEMLLHDKQPILFIRKGRNNQKDDRVEAEVTMDYEVKRSSTSATIDMTYYLYNLHDCGNIKKHYFKLRLDDLSRKNKLEDMQDDNSLELL